MLLGAARAEVSRRAAFMPRPQDELRAFVEDTGFGDLDRLKIVTMVGDAVGEIIEQASRRSSDLIVMGTRGVREWREPCWGRSPNVCSGKLGVR